MRRLSTETDGEDIIRKVTGLRKRLSDFEQRLPSNLKFVPRNLYLHSNASQKITFVMLQSWWHECHCNLFRFTLPGFRESVNLSSHSSRFVQECHDQVLASAVAQSNLWKLVGNMGNIPMCDTNIVVLVHSNTRTMLAIRRLTEAGAFRG